MQTTNNNSEKEIEFRVYSNDEHIDIFKFHPVIGEKIWQALMDIAITGDLTALKRIAESNKLERFIQYVRDNAWQRYAFDDIRKRTPLNAYISPTQEVAFKKAILALVSDGSIRPYMFYFLWKPFVYGVLKGRDVASFGLTGFSFGTSIDYP